MRLLVVILISLFYTALGQDTIALKREPQISVLIGQVAHSSEISSQYNRTKAPFATSAFLDINFSAFLTKRNQVFIGTTFSNYKFKYAAYYLSRPDFESYSISRSTGSGSGYIKASLMHGYSLVQTSHLHISTLFGPNINFLGRTGLWGESRLDLVDSTLNYTSKTVITDSILKVRPFGLGVNLGANVLYKIETNKDIYLNFKLLYNYGLNALYEIHTKTITNGNVYDRSKITGKGSGIFISTGITLMLGQKRRPGSKQHS